jgi:GAF domain-containing protein/signal transduction histidine kinase
MRGQAGKLKRTAVRAAKKAPAKPRRSGTPPTPTLARLRAERDEARAQQVATAEILEIINRSSGDPAPVFDAILERAMRLCDAAFGGLLVPDGEFIKYLTFRNVPERFTNFLMHNQVRARTMFGPDWASGATFNIADLSQSEGYRRRIPVTVSAVEDGGIRAMLLVPMTKEGAFVGAFTIYRQEMRPFTDRQVALARSFADQAVIAMENARLLTETREALEKQTATAEILRVISASPTDLQPTFDAIAARATRLSDAVTGVIFRFDGSLIHYGAGYGMTEAETKEVRAVFPLPPGRGSATARAILTRDIVHIHDPAADSDFVQVRLARFGTILSIPMLRDGNPFGAITVTRQRVEPFSPAQVELLKTFADQAVIAIENVRLFNELRERTGDLQESLEYQTATSDVLKVISRSTFDLKPILKTLIETAGRLCNADGGGVTMREGEDFRYVTAIAEDALWEVVRNQSFGPSRATLTGRVLLEGGVVHIPDVEADPDYELAGAVTAGRLRTGLAVPLLHKGAVIGTLNMVRFRVEPFTDRQIALIRTFADQAVIAIENARLLTELRESLEQQQAIAEVLQAINSSPGNLAPVFDAILEKAHTLCGASRGSLFLADGEGFRAAATRGYPDELDARLRASVTRADGPAFGPLLDGARIVHQPDLLATIRPDDAVGLDVAIRGGVRTNLMVPLRKDGKLLGFISCNRTEVRPFSNKEIALIESFAAQAVIAMDNARLLTELRARTSDLQESLEYQTATSDVLKVISRSAFDLETVLQTVATAAVRLCRADSAAVYRNEGGVYRWAAGHLLVPEYEERERNVAIRPGTGTVIGRVALEKRTIHILDAWTDPLYEAKDDAQVGGVHTMLGVPLLRDGVPIGAFGLARRRVEAFSEREIALVTTFADQAVIAVENARLLTELRVRTTDLQESLEYQTATSDVLKVISRSTFDLTPVLQYVLDTAMRLCRTHGGSIFRLDGTIYRWAVGKGLDPVYEEIEKNTPITPDEGTVVGRAALRRQTVQIRDAWDDPLYAQKESARITVARTMLGVPLLREGVPIGVIAMARRVVEPFTDSEIDLVTTFADQAVIAIENARLLTELRESLEQQQAIAEVLQVINASPGNLAPVYDAILEKSHSLCGATTGSLLLLDAGGVNRLVAMRGQTPFAEGQQLQAGPNHPVRRLIAGESFVQIADIREVDDPIVRAGAASGARTLVIIALRKEENLLGFITGVRDEVRPFTDKQIALLQSFAAQAVIAMDNARLLNEIRQRQAELRVTFDNMGDAVIMFDGEQRLVAWNRNFLHMLDIPGEWLASPRTYRDFADYLTARGEFGDAPAPDLGGPDSAGDIRPIRYERTRPDGRILEVRRNPIPGGAGFVFIYADITERKQAERSILAAREAAEAALADLKLAQANLIQSEKMASLGALTAGIAHEIKNPLNFVNNFANLSNELLAELKETAAPAFATLDADKRDEIDETMEMLSGNLEKIQEHGKRADGIVKSMLAHSRGGSGDRRDADVNALVEESLNLAYHGARAQDQNFNITLERDYDKAMKPIELVPQDVTRVFLNLCGNGFYAANKRRKEDGGADFRPVLKVATRELGDAVEVRIRDNGIGIPPEVRDKLFQPFFTTKPTGEGTGLGLSISYDIVTQQHGGTIAVDSRVGDFTEFTIRLPRKR